MDEQDVPSTEQEELLEPTPKAKLQVMSSETSSASPPTVREVSPTEPTTSSKPRLLRQAASVFDNTIGRFSGRSRDGQEGDLRHPLERLHKSSSEPSGSGSIAETIDLTTVSRPQPTTIVTKAEVVATAEEPVPKSRRQSRSRKAIATAEDSTDEDVNVITETTDAGSGLDSLESVEATPKSIASRIKSGLRWTKKSKSVDSSKVTSSPVKIVTSQDGDDKNSEKTESDLKSGSHLSPMSSPRKSILRASSMTSVSTTSDTPLAPILEEKDGNSTPATLTKKLAEQPIPTSDNILGIHVHNTDRKLKSSKLILHPVVKVHILDVKTGQYLSKKNKSRNVTSYYEGNGRRPEVDYVLPMMTQPCDLVKYIRYPRAPLWEELLLYNEDYEWFLENEVVILFEILDFWSLDSFDQMSKSFTVNNISSRTGSSILRRTQNGNVKTSWWHRVAWAFLRVVGGDGRHNVDKKLRLQLFKPISASIPRTSCTSPNDHPESTTGSGSKSTDLFLWWKDDRKVPFPASIYVTVKAIPLGQVKVLPSLRSLLPFQEELGLSQLLEHSALKSNPRRRKRKKSTSPTQATAKAKVILHPETETEGEVSEEDEEESDGVDDEGREEPETDGGLFLNRSVVRISSSGLCLKTPEAQVIYHPTEEMATTFQVPKSPWKEFSAGNNRSCYSLKFSNDGRRLACGASVFAAYLSAEKRSSVFIYDLPSGNFFRRVNGFHLGTIYDIDWSFNDRLVMSASNDSTAQIWPVDAASKSSSVVLGHPCFIYSCKFGPTKDYQHLVFTGSFDGLIRVWSIRRCFEVHPGMSSKDPELLREIDGFQGQILSLTFKSFPLASGSIVASNYEIILFSAGSNGSITLWKNRREPPSGHYVNQLPDPSNWVPTGKIRVPDLKNIPINCIKMSPLGTKMLLCCRDGILRMIDYDMEVVVQTYPGSVNFSHLIRGSLSPCGRYVFMGSEDGLAHVWAADSGERLFTYDRLPFKGPVTCIEYHPFEPIVAISGLGGRTVSVMCYKHREPDDPESPVSSSPPPPTSPYRPTSGHSPLGQHQANLFNFGKIRPKLQKSMTVDSNNVPSKFRSAATRLASRPPITQPQSPRRSRGASRQPSESREGPSGHSGSGTSTTDHDGGSRMKRAMKRLEIALKMKSLDRS